MTRARAIRGASSRHLRTVIGVALVISAVAVLTVLALRPFPGMTLSADAKILGIALAVGLDVLALSIAVGVMRVPWKARLRLGLSFSAAEVLMQVLGYGIGTGAGRIVGVVAPYVGFFILAIVGIFIARESFAEKLPSFRVDSGLGLVAASASISLDSLGIGVSLPGVPLPLLPLLATVAVTTVIFTAIGLAFGERLGRRYRRAAQGAAGVVLIVLAVFFTIQHLEGWMT